MKVDRAFIYHNLGVMLQAGVPILRCFDTMSSGLRGKWSRVMWAIREGIRQGDSLSGAMAKQGRLFSPMEVQVVQTGELSGNLSDTLELLAQWFELAGRTKSRIRSGLILPGLLVFFTAFLTGPVSGLVLGNVTPGQYLTATGRTIGYFYLPAIMVLGIIYLKPSRGWGRLLLDMLALRIPLLGKAIKYQAISRYCRAFHLFTKAGVDAVETARQAADTCGNAVVAGYFRGAMETVKEGNTFSEGFSRGVPVFFRESWLVGEESGTLDETTERLANSAAETAEKYFQAFSSWFPKLIYFIIVIWMAVLVLRGFSAIYGNLLKTI